MPGDGARRLRLAESTEAGPEDLVGEYLATLSGRSASTVDAYGRILRQFARWAAGRTPSAWCRSRGRRNALELPEILLAVRNDLCIPP